ncbi:MAG: PstC family ABC transporter permease [Eubacteriales bacterium]
MLTFGLLGLIVGTLFSTVFALFFSGMLGLGCAVAICELAPKKLASLIISFIRLLASIPSVIFGLVGVIFVVPWVEKTFITVDMQIEYLQFFQMTGRNLLTTTIVLSIMIVPTLVSMACDALYAVPNIYGETGAAFGMNKMRITSRILLLAARPGIIAGFVLAAGRGIGEAIAVSMVCGGLGMIPKLSHGLVGLLTPILPLSAAIINKSEAMSVPAVENALFSCGALLLVMGTVLSLIARIIIKRSVKRGMISES